MNNVVMIKDVRGYVGENNVAYLNLEDVARGLGFEREKNGKMYVMWDRVKKYLGIQNEFKSKDGLLGYITQLQLQKLIQSTNKVVDDKWYELAGLKKNTIILTKEQETIGFICDCLKDITQINLQHKIGKYKIDLYLPEYNLAIECDELSHQDRDGNYEVKREEYIKKELGCKFIRFNPDSEMFKISDIICSINKHIVFSLQSPQVAENKKEVNDYE